MEIVVFCGGRGAQALQEAFSIISNIKVTYIINGYDNGLSTGLCRLAIPGLLGPSDFRKATSSILVNGSESEKLVGSLLETRIEWKELQKIFNRQNTISLISRMSPTLSVKKAFEISEYITSASAVLSEIDSSEHIAIGNLLLSGLYLKHNDFNVSLKNWERVLELNSRFRIINATEGEDVFLGATTESGFTTIEEYVIVEKPGQTPIEKLFLVSREQYLKETRRNEWELSSVDYKTILPKPNSEAIEKIQSADIIIYSTGTRHSSLYPTFLTSGISSSIKENIKASKIYLTNSKRDRDIHEMESELNLIDKLLYVLDGKNKPEKCISKVWSTKNEMNNFEVHEYFDLENKIEASPAAKLLWEEKSVTKVIEDRFTPLSIHNIIYETLDTNKFVTFDFTAQLTSIIIPSVESPETLSKALKQLISSDIRFDFPFEVVVAARMEEKYLKEIAYEFPEIIFLYLMNNGSRYEAINKAMKVSRGAQILIWSADCEYDPQDIFAFVGALKRYPSALIIGSRSHSIFNADSLQVVYKNQKSLYWISRIGGALISFVLSIRISRSLSDPLCGILAMPRVFAETNIPVSGGAEGHVEIIKRAQSNSIGIVELGIGYTPRSRRNGKTTGVLDGIKALHSIVFK